MTPSHCAALVRAHDHDRYLCTLFAPVPVREVWFALFAFNHEIAVIAESVTEELTGLMRFAWWREVLNEIYAGGTVRRHPVAQALAQAVRAHELPRMPLQALLDAREAAFMGKSCATIEEWEDYFRATSSGLLELCAVAAGMAPTKAIADLGIAWGCIGTVRIGENALLLQTAAKYLDSAYKALPVIFLPFRDTAAFYLKRLGRDKKTRHAFLLPLTLWLRDFLRRIA